MTVDEFKAKYPKVFALLNIISYDADMPLLETGIEDLNILPAMEEEAGKISGYETANDDDSDVNDFVMMAIGEDSAKNALVNRLGIHQLDAFLDSAFDGDYTEVFYG